MNYLLSGGAKNGKSMLAQKIVKSMQPDRPIYYLATMIPHDEEDRARIARHLQDRDGWGFTTIECGKNILHALDRADTSGAFLLDSVTALLANEMFLVDGRLDRAAPTRVADELAEFAARTGYTVFVSDCIYADAGIYDEWTACYRAGLALIDRRLAQVCGGVAELCAGNALWYKGEWRG